MSNQKRKNKQTRIDEQFAEWTKDVSIDRIKKGLEKEVISPREITRIMLNAPSFKDIDKELRTMRRRKI